MNCSRRQQMMTSLSLLVTALTFTAILLVLAIRRRSLWQALLAVAGAGTAAGALLLLRDCEERTAAALASDGELLDETESRAATRRIHHTLGGDR